MSSEHYSTIEDLSVHNAPVQQANGSTVVFVQQTNHNIGGDASKQGSLLPSSSCVCFIDVYTESERSEIDR